MEKLDHLLQRALRFLQFIQREYKDQTVLAVGHGIVNKAIQAVYHGCQMKDVTRMTNAEVRMLQLDHNLDNIEGTGATNDKKFCIT